MIAAGVNAKALSTYIGHTSITITVDRYEHLTPGNEKEAENLLDAFVDKPASKEPVRNAGRGAESKSLSLCRSIRLGCEPK